jgi:hypothetical protein
VLFKKKMNWCGMKRIGIDFDNTIVDYDAVFFAAAKERSLVDESLNGGKEAVRDALRLLPNGENAWQSLQAYVYGRRIRDAAMFEGLDSFLRLCRMQAHQVCVVSHKTEYGHFDEARVNLRQAALAWMSARGFFDADGFGLNLDDVFFEGSRAEKIERIAGCASRISSTICPRFWTTPRFLKTWHRSCSPRESERSAARPNAFAHWREIAEAVLK